MKDKVNILQKTNPGNSKNGPGTNRRTQGKEGPPDSNMILERTSGYHFLIDSGASGCTVSPTMEEREQNL